MPKQSATAADAFLGLVCFWVLQDNAVTSGGENQVIQVFKATNGKDETHKQTENTNLRQRRQKPVCQDRNMSTSQVSGRMTRALEQQRGRHPTPGQPCPQRVHEVRQAALRDVDVEDGFEIGGDNPERFCGEDGGAAPPIPPPPPPGHDGGPVEIIAPPPPKGTFMLKVTNQTTCIRNGMPFLWEWEIFLFNTNDRTFCNPCQMGCKTFCHWHWKNITHSYSSHSHKIMCIYPIPTPDA